MKHTRGIFVGRSLRKPLLVGAVAALLAGCHDHDGTEDMGQGDMAPPAGACAAPPAVPAGDRCAVQPGAGKAVLLRGTLLLPDKVIENGELLVGADGRIACADTCCYGEARDATVVSCPDAVISPGLINTHDHITYTKAAPAAHGENRYDHRHEWRNGVMGDPNKPKIPVPGGNNASAVQWGELRHLMGGATSLVGSGQAKGVLRNLDTASQEGLSEGTVDFDTFPLGDSSGKMLPAGCDYPSIHKASELDAVDAYLPHVGEGVNGAAHNEFLCVSSMDNGGQDLMGQKTALIHGVALSPEDGKLMAARHAALIWSPRSNIDLYGHTASIPMLDRAGVLIALGTDWSASGSMNLLRELACARDLNKNQFGGYLSDESLWRMVTHNAALATATIDSIGQIKKGHVADLAVFRGGADRKAHSAVVQAEVQDVLLVLRGGLPMYGEAKVLEGLGLGEGKGCEALDVCGAQKRICAERETGKKLADLETAAGKPIYQLFACGAPPMEPSCVPFRRGEFDGMSTMDDPDGDGLVGSMDNCPAVFNPVRPMDGGKQPDADGDGLGDACDPCPLDKEAMSCPGPAPDDRDGDGVPDRVDNCLGAANMDQKDGDMDGLGDACDACPAFANPGASPCPFKVVELRDPALGKRPKSGSKVVLQDLLVIGLQDKKSYGFFARDVQGGADYSAVFVFTGGSAASKAADGTPIQVGQIVQLKGTFTEYNKQDEISDVAELKVTGMGMATAFDIMPGDLLGGPAKVERLENQLVRIQGVTMKRQVPPPAMPMGAMEDDFWVTSDPMESCAADPPACVRVGDFLLDGDKADMNPPFMAGGVWQSVTGIINGFRDQYSLEPRTTTDLAR